MRLHLLLAGMLIAGQTTAQNLGPGTHHGELSTGRSVPTITLSGALNLSAGTVHLNMGAIGADRAINILSTPDHRGHTHCRSACTMRSPSNSTLLAVEPGARLIITDTWAPQGKADLRIAVSAPEAPTLRPGTMEFRGDLDATAAGGTVSIYGTVPALPLPLVRAAWISGTWTARTIPPGTVLEITHQNITLKRTPK